MTYGIFRTIRKKAVTVIVKMKIFAFLAATFVLFSGLPSAMADQSDRIDKLQSRADNYFAEHKYKKARAIYFDLARIGDRFSQYRLSLYSLQGLTGDVDLPESFAWAELAAQGDDQQLQLHRDGVWLMMTAEQQKQAANLAMVHLNQFSDHAIARRALDKSKEELRSCTGSRLGSTCEQVYSAMLARGNGIIPASASASVAAARVNKGNSGQNVGAETRDVPYFQELRSAMARLEMKLEELESGNVELGEFEVIEPEPEAQTENGEQQ